MDARRAGPADPIRHAPFWVDRHDRDQEGSPRGGAPAATARPVVYDLAIVGAGVVGATAALEAVERGLSVVIIEAERDAARGVSGQAAATVSAGLGAPAATIERAHGHAVAIEYLRAAAWGLGRVRGLAAISGGATGAVDHDHDLIASHDSDVRGLLRGAELADEAGIATCAIDPESPTVLPFGARAAVRYPGQLLIDPVAYVRDVLQVATALGCDVLMGAAATVLDAGDPHELGTRRGRVRARHVFVATHVPVFHRTLAFAAIVQRRRFAVAGDATRQVPVADDVSGRRIGTRPMQADGRHLAITSGGWVAPGRSPGAGAESMHAVATWAETNLGMRVTHAWSSQDADPADGLPLAGPVPGTPGLWIATGFAGWGFTLGTAAAADVVRRIAGEEPMASSWRPDRQGRARGLVRGLATVSAIGARTAQGVVADALALPPTDLAQVAASLAPGEGMVVRDGLRPQAVCMDRQGTVHVVSGRCTHLGCVVSWDSEAVAWACPCHGARFAPDGSVLHGPATAPLRSFGDARHRPTG